MSTTHLPSVIDLVLDHLRILPVTVLERGAIGAAIADPDWAGRLHYADAGSCHIKAYVAIENDDVVAAAQLLLPQGEDELDQAVLSWLVGRPEFEGPGAFASHLVRTVTDAGRSRIVEGRVPFVNGGAGTPDCWPHILDVTYEAGFHQESEWKSYWHDRRRTDVALPPGLQIEMRRDTSENKLKLIVNVNGERIGEVIVWLPPTFLDPHVTDIEWVEVYEPRRGKGWGKVVLAAGMEKARKHGATSFVLWTEDGNVAMQRLAEGMGFGSGPVFHWLRRGTINVCR